MANNITSTQSDDSGINGTIAKLGGVGTILVGYLLYSLLKKKPKRRRRRRRMSTVRRYYRRAYTRRSKRR